MRHRAREFVQYHERVLATDPIAYWPLDEKQGTVAYDWVSGRSVGAQNGAHTGVTLYQPGIGDGRTSPLYDGVNDYTNIHSAAFVAAFNGAEGTAAIWARVNAAGVWTDGQTRMAFYIAVDGNNRVTVGKSALNNTIFWTYTAGGVNLAPTNASTSTDWMHMAVKWSKRAGESGEMRGYLNGAQPGATQINLGVWAGALNNTTTVIGAQSTVPALIWLGWLGHCAVWDRALSAATIADLYRARWA